MLDVAVLYLAKYPEMQEKAYDEIQVCSLRPVFNFDPRD
jgi:hypothetical protein